MGKGNPDIRPARLRFASSFDQRPQLVERQVVAIAVARFIAGDPRSRPHVMHRRDSHWFLSIMIARVGPRFATRAMFRKRSHDAGGGWGQVVSKADLVRDGGLTLRRHPGNHFSVAWPEFLDAGSDGGVGEAGVGTAQTFRPSLSVETVPPCLTQAAAAFPSFGSSR